MSECVGPDSPVAKSMSSTTKHPTRTAVGITQQLGMGNVCLTQKHGGKKIKHWSKNIAQKYWLIIAENHLAVSCRHGRLILETRHLRLLFFQCLN